MKKILAFVLVTVMLAACLVACGDGKGGDKVLKIGIFEPASGANGAGGKRAEMKRLIAQFRKLSPNIEMSIFRSCHNVNLNTVIGYTLNGVQHDFVREYAQSENGFAGE